jgi:hypothetical protein
MKYYAFGFCLFALLKYWMEGFIIFLEDPLIN